MYRVLILRIYMGPLGVLEVLGGLKKNAPKYSGCETGQQLKLDRLYACELKCVKKQSRRLRN